MSIIKSFSVGEGDMFYIKHDTDNFTIIDCCLSEDNKYNIVNELIAESKGKNITRFISTHPDDDHIRGLEYLDTKMNILNFYCVKNEATKEDETDDFKKYCSLRDDTKKAFYIYKDCSRRWMNLDNEERKNAGISILWPNTNNEYYKSALDDAKKGNNPNNISPIVRYVLNGGNEVLWMGDLENVFMSNIKDEIKLQPVSILFAPHHGRATGKVPDDWLKSLNPKLIIIGEAPSEDLNYYEGYNTITQNSSGDIVLECVTGKTNIYVSNKNYSVDFLDNEYLQNTFGQYIGTLKM